MAMSKRAAEIERLEKAFWQSMVDGKPTVATRMLTEPALMVSSHGVTRFDHASYTKMAKDDRYKLVDYRMSDVDVLFPKDDVAVASYRVNQTMEMEGRSITNDVFDTSTWVKVDDEWLCVAHTESEAAPQLQYRIGRREAGSGCQRIPTPFGPHPAAGNCTIDSRLPSGSRNQATRLPSGARTLPSASCPKPAKRSKRTPRADKAAMTAAMSATANPSTVCSLGCIAGTGHTRSTEPPTS